MEEIKDKIIEMVKQIDDSSRLNFLYVLIENEYKKCQKDTNGRG